MTTTNSQSRSPGSEPEEHHPERGFWHYWTASTISSFGSGVTTPVLPLIALQVVNPSNFEVSLITTASFAAVVLVGLPAGVIVQRFDLRMLQVGLDLFRALAVLSIPLTWALGALTVPQLLAVAFLIGLASNVFDVANTAFLPQVVPRAQLIRRNGLLSGSVATTQLAGPAAGGVLVQTVGAALTVLVDVVSYLVSAVLLARIPATARPHRPQGEGGFVGQIAVGLRFVFRHPVLRSGMLAATAANLTNGAVLAVLPLFVNRQLGLPASAYGVILALDGLGGVAGALLADRLSQSVGSARAVVLATTLAIPMTALMPLASVFTGASAFAAAAVLSLGLVGLASGFAILAVVIRSHRQAVTPPEVIGRVAASVRFVSWTAIPIGALLAGAAAQLWNPAAGLIFASCTVTLVPLALWLSPVRRLHHIDEGGA
jgi:MFS family permease